VFPVCLPALWWCRVIAALAGVSDVLDGHFARQKGSGTRAGELVDSIADGVERFTVFLVFVGIGILPVWTLLLALWRGVPEPIRNR
jgi:phosphatidylglycerophosphate synthase